MMSEPLQSITEKEEHRGKILGLQSVMEQMPQIEIPIEHSFAPGLYLRQMTMPEGSTVVGKIHKTEHLCILAQGSVQVATEDGLVTYSAPKVIHSFPGAKRALHALSKVVWINVHHNPENVRDLEKIESHYVTNTYEEFLSFTEQKKLKGDE